MTSPGCAPTHRSAQYAPICRLGLALLLTGVLFTLLSAGCTFSSEPADPFADFRQTWAPGFVVEPALLQALPAYSITVTVNSAAKTYTGSLTLSLPVTGAQPLRDLYFRTYPNLYGFGGAMQVSGASVNGKVVNFAPTADRSAVHLALPEPLAVGSQAEIGLAFSGKVERPSQPGAYTIFGFNEDVLNLTGFYPILAGRRGDEWAVETPHPQGDVGFHDAALYRVTLTAPPGQVIVATGTEITQTVGADGWRTTRYLLGPAREFTVLLSPRFQFTETETLGTRVCSYFYPEDAAAGQVALYHAVAALQIYSDRYGAYPYREMSVVEAPLTIHGMEFPGVSLIGSQVYNKHRGHLETLVVHEVAHQWWYNQVGSDQVRSPWQDEGLAEYTLYDYTTSRYGTPRAVQLRAQRWQVPADAVVRRGADAPIGLPVESYAQDYETLVYGKGALFFLALRAELGEATFERFLRTYLERYRWRIATPADFSALATEIAGRDLEALFVAWLGK